MKLNKPIKCIFFDIEGTLNYSPSEHWMFPSNTDNIINIECIYYVPISRFTNAYRACKSYLEENHKTATIEQEYEKFIKFYSIMDKELPEFELNKDKIKSLAYEKVYNPENNVFFDDAHHTVKKLSENFKLGIIADSWPSAENSLKNAGLYEFFNCITLSCHRGKYMPDPTMIAQALKLADVNPEETVFIDDSKENLLEAQKFGIQTIWFNSKNPKNDENFLTIHTLSDILEHI